MINNKWQNVSKQQFENNKILIDTDFDFNKNLFGEIFDFTIIPFPKEKNIEKKIEIKSIKRSKNERTIYFKIPVELRKEISEKYIDKISCAHINNIFIFVIHKKEQI